MRPVDYDAVAGAYGRRYELHDYSGIEHAVLAFAATAGPAHVFEVGCGTGHWLAILAPRAAVAVGIDPSRAMLEQARLTAPGGPLIQGRAEALPLRAASFDRVICVNALHHFADPGSFLAEARRVLRPGGGLLTVGLDPHAGRDRWWVYDCFPEALTADCARYLAAPEIRRLMTAAGFVACETREAQHMRGELPVRVAIEQGLLDRRSTSQLMVISDDAYRAGVERVRAARPAAGEGEPTLRADLRLYATTGWLPADAVPPGT